MATIKQLEKSLERAKKELNKYDTACKRYSDLVMKKLSELHKIGYGIQVSDLMTNPYTLTDRLGIDCSSKAFNMVFSAVHNREYYDENKRRYDCSVKENARLLQELKQAEAIKESKEEKYDTKLEIALTEAFAAFKEKFVLKMMVYFSKHAIFVEKNKEEWKKKLDDAKHERGVFYKENFPLTRETRDKYEMLSSQVSKFANLLNDEYFKFKDTAEYLNAKREWVNDYWVESIHKLTEKCSGMNVNKELISVSEPVDTGKGFEVVVQDGGNRVIYARLIWAAEYSDIVTPHFRYIVTEHRI